jgi:hypothetical protein
MDARWRTIPFEGRAKGITAYDGRGNKAVLWTEKDIYMVEPSGVEKIKVNAGENTNIKVASGEKYLFLLTDKNCMMMDKSTKRWKSIMNFDGNSYSEKSEEEEHNTGVEVCRAYMAPNKDKLLIYVSSQLYLYNINTGSRETLNITGISAASINCIDLSGTIPIIASGNDLFLIRGSKGYPEVLFSAEGQYAISTLYACCREKNMTVWAGAGNILYKVKIEPENNGYVNSGITAADIVSVKEVQRMAIAYAEVDPEKIDNWRKAAKIKAILPKVSFDISESDDGNVEIYKSATKYYIVNGPREIDRDWSVGLSWDLSDLIWNDAQTSIDVRSKLMVQMRNDILEEVTRLYFERIRLESELLDLAESSDKDRDIRRKKIRIEEITAYIDAYTGGGFSSKILSKKNNRSLVRKRNSQISL